MTESESAPKVNVITQHYHFEFAFINVNSINNRYSSAVAKY